MTLGARKTQFSSLLLQWYQDNARELPWRRTHDPYKIWISEIMLQQTQVSTVIPYYNCFIQNFPDINALNEASLEKVLTLWSGLGYYKRARQMKDAARIISEQFSNHFPQTKKELLSLPGIGPYTAGAILSIALNLPYPVVDGNVIRVLSRYFAINEAVNQKNIKERLWDLAKELIPETQARQFNQALMELGALICKAKWIKDICLHCPVSKSCMAFEKNIVHQIPKLPKKKKKEKVNLLTFLFYYQNQFIVMKRGSTEKVLKDMWELPTKTINHKGHQKESLSILKNNFNLDRDKVNYISSISHNITYRSITCYVYYLEIDKKEAVVLEKMCRENSTTFKWVNYEEALKLPHSSIQKKIMALFIS